MNPLNLTEMNPNSTKFTNFSTLEVNQNQNPSLRKVVAKVAVCPRLGWAGADHPVPTTSISENLVQNRTFPT